MIFVGVFCLSGVELRNQQSAAEAQPPKGGDRYNEADILAIYARLDAIENSLQNSECDCSDCMCKGCEESRAEQIPVGSSSAAVESVPHFTQPITVDGITHEFDEYIQNHYRRDWVYNGRRYCPASHLTWHGIPAEQANALTSDQRLKLHSALHEAGVEPAKTQTRQVAVKQQPVRIIWNSQNCPNGLCPQR